MLPLRELAIKILHFFKFIYFIETERRHISREGGEKEEEGDSQEDSGLPAQNLTQGLNPGTVRS